MAITGVGSGVGMAMNRRDGGDNFSAKTSRKNGLEKLVALATNLGTFGQYSC
jgi:hypothetical protein